MDRDTPRTIDIDHVTIVVQDMVEAKALFALLGFEESLHRVFSGEAFERYMGVAGIEAEHTTLRLKGPSPRQPRQEIQLLRYIHPEPQPNSNIARLDTFGFNHVCFAVTDIEAEVARLRAAGVQFENEITQFNDKRLVFFRGPGGVTLELAQYLDPNPA